MASTYTMQGTHHRLKVNMLTSSQTALRSRSVNRPDSKLVWIQICASTNEPWPWVLLKGVPSSSVSSSVSTKPSARRPFTLGHLRMDQHGSANQTFDNKSKDRTMNQNHKLAYCNSWKQ